jgi:DNA-binding response OmpR family regulator
LLFRVNKKLNRINIASSSKQQYRLKRLNFVPFEKVIYLHSTPVHLSSLESAVLTILCENMDKFVDKNMIIREVWDVEDTKSKEASFNNVISKLRKILRAEHEVKIESGLKAKVRITLG